MTRREFEILLAAAGGSIRAAAEEVQVEGSGAHIGSLYPFAQKQADRAPIELSFLRPEFHDLKQWQPRARVKVFEHLFYALRKGRSRRAAGLPPLRCAPRF